MDLGAPPLRTFLSVTLPLILPAIAAAWMLAFALSLDDLVIASFTTGPGATTLPIRIYSEVRLGVKPEMNAVCSIMVGVVGVAVIVASLLAKLTGARGAPARLTAVNPGFRPAAGTDRARTRAARSPARRAAGSAAPRRALRAPVLRCRSDEDPAVLISSSVVMPKCARIVPTISDATSTLTSVRVRRLSIAALVAGSKPALIRARVNHRATSKRRGTARTDRA